MSVRRVAVGSLGGTITMVGGPGGGEPRLGAEDLVAGLPGLDGEGLDVETVTLQQLPGASLTPAHLVEAVDWARGRVDAGSDGVVLVQGTDTLPETAFLLDLYWDRTGPLVLTGAMRLASALGADGPANLRDACLAASTREVASQGVVVCLDGQLHRADRVEKSHSWTTGAFSSGLAGVAGVVTEGMVHLYAEGRRRGVGRVGPPVHDPRVVVWKTYLGDDGRELRDLVERGGVDGLVVEGFGVGHVPARAAHVLAEVATSLPVVAATSAERGGTLTFTYGFPGSEMDIVERGVLLYGELSARKARLAMWAWLAQGGRRERDSPRELLTRY